MFKKAFLLLFILSFKCMVAQITLTHNICDDIKETGFPSCSSGMQHWARAFYLSDFGISNNEEFIINSGQIGISDHGGGATVTFYIYEIDNNFPNVFTESNLIGSSKEIQIPGVYGNDNSGTIFEIEFDTPIKVDYTVERILVVAKVGAVWGSGVIFIGGTEQDYDHSWFRGCVIGEYEKFTIVGENFNFFINVTGDTNHITNNFEMNISNICSEFLKEFSIEKKENIASIVWDFGDPASRTENTSIDISPYHDFTMDGTYTITATVTSIDGSVIVLTETINVIEPPNAYGIDNIYACEDSFGSEFSSSFDISDVEAQILGGQTDKTITYIDGNGNEYDILPNPFTNTVENQETITVRVAHDNNLCCYSETTFDLIVNDLPEANEIQDLTRCESQSNGYANFDLSNVETYVLGGQTGMVVSFFDGNGNLLPNPLPNPYINSIPNQEAITVRVINNLTGCKNETSFTLNVNELPIANQINNLFGCDDNNDGISEYFDTSNVESQVLNGKTGMSVSYFDLFGNELPSPLPNPYTNSNAFNQLITVRVTDNISTCYEETTLQLKTVTQPNISQPENLYACDQGSGYAEFDTSLIEQKLIGNQTGSKIQYFDSDNKPLPSPLPILFQNTEPFTQTIHIRVEDNSNPICYSETSFELIVNELPEINLENEYFICNLEPSILLNVNSGYNSYNWFFEDGTLISSTNNGEITEEGNYTLTVTQIENGITCENSFDFALIRSILPEIQQINFGELGNNYIEIIASDDGDFEYSIDGINYQDSNYFSNIQGGMYSVFVRDKDGCGQDSEEVTVIDYPKFFTPNDDGYNDFWQIRGIANFPNSETFIFDRYGKLLARISSNDLGWNGQYNGRQMMSNNYWFRTDLGNGRTLSGHFSLKR
jgi:gliding motility-associated-like protein